MPQSQLGQLQQVLVSRKVAIYDDMEGYGQEDEEEEDDDDDDDDNDDYDPSEFEVIEVGPVSVVPGEAVDGGPEVPGPVLVVPDPDDAQAPSPAVYERYRRPEEA